MTHTVILQVAEANHCAAAYTAHHDNLANLAHDAVALEAVQLAASSFLEPLNGVLEE